MNASQIIFYILSGFILVAAVLAVTTRKIFRAAIWLLFSLVSIAGLYFWMELAFIAAVQVIVYVGGIVVMIIFSVFLTQQSGKAMPLPANIRTFFALLAVLFGVSFTGFLVLTNGFTAVDTPFRVDTATIGMQLLSTTEHGYVLPFEVISMLLLAALVGCIVIALKDEVAADKL